MCFFPQFRLHIYLNRIPETKPKKKLLNKYINSAIDIVCYLGLMKNKSNREEKIGIKKSRRPEKKLIYWMHVVTRLECFMAQQNNSVWFNFDWFFFLIFVCFNKKIKIYWWLFNFNSFEQYFVCNNQSKQVCFWGLNS